MARFISFVLILMAMAVGSHAVECWAASKCRFHFCGGRTSFKLNPENDTPFTGPICDKRGLRIGTINTAQVKIETSPTSYSSLAVWNPEGEKPNPKFTPTIFSSYHQTLTKYYTNKQGKKIEYYIPYSAIGHQAFAGNQKKLINNKCILVTVSKFQVLSKDGSRVIDNVDLYDSQESFNCVSLRVSI